ncbi:MAG: cytochrome c553, partial [Myxococcota bacterium]
GAAPPEVVPVDTVVPGVPVDTVVPVDTERGLKKCRLCHGDDLGGKRAVPNIAGMRPNRVLRKLTAEIPRKMLPVVRGLSQEERAAIASVIGAMEKIERAPAPTPGAKRRK